MHVIFAIRPATVSPVPVLAPPSPFDIGVEVRARAMLQLFAPRSRTFGKCLLIS